VLTQATGQVGIVVLRNRDGTFEQQIARKQRRLNGVDEIVLSLLVSFVRTGIWDLGSIS
jgi:putative transposase